jgi:hypothetical protein
MPVFTDDRSDAARALDDVRDSVEDQGRSRVEQDKVASQQTILDVVRKTW